MKVKARSRQTLSDIAVQVYGDVRAAVLIAETNSLDIAGELPAGIELECPDTVYDRYMQDYAHNNGVSPALTLDPAEDINAKIFTEQFMTEFN